MICIMENKHKAFGKKIYVVATQFVINKHLKDFTPFIYFNPMS